MHILVTGAAGFIGFHASLSFLRAGHRVVGIDNLNDYYSPALKEDRLALLRDFASFRFERLDLADDSGMERLFGKERFSHVVHLAAQAGVRYSLKNPRAYIQSNLAGFGNILEGCRQTRVELSDLRIFQFRVRLKYSDAFFRRPECGSSSQLVRGHEKVQRAYGAQLQPFVWAALHRPAVFYRVRSLGQT